MNRAFGIGMRSLGAVLPRRNELGDTNNAGVCAGDLVCTAPEKDVSNEM